MAKEKKKSTFWSDFKAFLSRGNVLDMAVGVIIGGAFGKIVSGLVNYILNPIIGFWVKTGSLDNWKTILKPEVVDEVTGDVITAESAILWGSWLQTIIDFVITALCIFLILRVITKARAIAERKKIEEAEKKAAEEKAAAEVAAKAAAEKEASYEASVRNQEVLLAEIRDLLAKKK
ncbi:MAG: large conductance mechanosensitive channel protein MscL [Ruminococcaceae bacterium]|nr:large conductance mechanosensitive channel protein MscL [Oscillospiraceae bacterium]